MKSRGVGRSQGAGRSLLPLMTTTSKGYGDYVVFVESKALRGRSKQEYLRQVRKLGEHYAGRELAGVTEREVFDYLVHRREVEKLRPSTLNQAVVALRMFYRDYLGRRWALWERFEIRRNHPLPVVLTRGETRRLLGSVRSGRFRAVLALIYHCGLRVGEAVALKPGHIDAQRGVVRIVEGKGGRMREVPISCAMVQRLRRYWSFHRNKRWLFPGVGRGWKDRTRSLSRAMGESREAMSVSAVQNALRMALSASGLKKNATCHTLRHSFATHLLEDGVSIRQVSTYLGHASLASTLVYLPVTEISESRGRQVQERLLHYMLGS